jgi:hypothetical protein
MARLFFLRIYLRVAGAIGLLSLAFFLVSLDPFLSAAPMAGTGTNSSTPPVSVNRALKGDRLPLFDSGVSSKGEVAPTLGSDELRARNRLQTRGKMPVGCDPAFSPVSSPSLSDVYGRCTV